MVVVAASAFAALTQLRHMRGANQMTSMLKLRERVESHEFSESYRLALRFLSEDLEKPEMRRTILTAERLAVIPEFDPVFAVGSFFENCGGLVKNEIIDREIFCDLLSAIVIGAWKSYAPFIAHRRLVAGKALYDNFEYLAVVCADWVAAHPDGTYPAGVRRMELPVTWPEAIASDRMP
jgi:hypothetical protein